MFCSNCGKQLADNVKFCTGCGTPIEAPVVQDAVPVQEKAAPVFKAPAAPAPKKGGKGFVLPIIIGAVVLVVALVLALVTGLFTSDKAKLAKALAKSAKSYQEASYQVELPEVYNEDKDMVCSQSVSVWVDSLPAMPEIEGMGVQLDMDVDIPGRETQMIATARYGSADIISAEVLLRDAELYADVPQITGGKPFMINTETLGQTLASYGVEEEGMEAFGFNIYDLGLMIKERLPMDVTFELPEEAVKEFAEAIEVEKVGKKDRDVNDHTLKCTVYDVVIPEKAMAMLIEACIDAVPEYDPIDAMELIVDVFREMGMPDYVVEEMEAEMDGAYASMGDTTDQFYDAYEMALEIIGDIELELSVHKGYVVSVYYENSIEGVDIELTVNMGGGENYVDDLRIEALMDDFEIILVSSGNHSGKGGVYTDVTNVEISVDGDEVEFTSELTYEPGLDDENFTWALDADMAKIELIGQITAGKDEAIVRLDEISVWSAGQKMATVGIEMAVRAYEGTTMNTSGAIDLSTITMDELYEEVMAMESTAMAWAESIMTNYPELAEMLDNL